MWFGNNIHIKHIGIILDKIYCGISNWTKLS